MTAESLISTSFKERCISLTDAKSQCIEKLKAHKIRLSKQRFEIIDILFSGSFTCTKELFYEAQAKNPELGMSTVYRFLKVLADVGIISKHKILDVNCRNCDFRKAILLNRYGQKISEGLNIHEILRLGLVVKGVIGSDEKIDVKMIDDELNISLK
jgi:Fur family ferric uptake transcriptional regulator